MAKREFSYAQKRCYAETQERIREMKKPKVCGEDLCGGVFWTVFDLRPEADGDTCISDYVRYVCFGPRRRYAEDDLRPNEIEEIFMQMMERELTVEQGYDQYRNYRRQILLERELELSCA